MGEWFRWEKARFDNRLVENFHDKKVGDEDFIFFIQTLFWNFNWK